MAFNKQVDADRVDDLGLLSSFLRAPLLGPVAWAVGKFAKPHDENKVPVCSAAPSLACIGQDFSSMSLASSETAVNDPPCISHHDDENDVQREDPATVNAALPLSKKTRKTSWSDESGKSLAKYYSDKTDQSSSSRSRTATSLIASNKPIKSAMRRSAPARTSMIPSPFIPSSLSADATAPKEVGFVLPNEDSCYNGYVSPQWGWYATGSTTPPTPEHFYAIPPRTGIPPKPKDAINSINKADTEEIRIKIQNVELTERTTIVGGQTTSRMKPVLKKGMPRDASGWPSVPL